MISLPKTHYAKSGNVHVAYQLFGEGPIDLVIVPGWISHLDIWWDSPITADWFRRFARYARVLLFDKRGTGLSDRNTGVPGMDERMDDIRAVMDAANSERASIFGISEGGSLAALFAATHPNRCQSLILHGAFARFTSWFPTQDDLDAFFKYVRSDWGSGGDMPKFSRSKSNDKSYADWWGRRERSAASPATAIDLMQLNSEIDISHVLSSVQVPTLVIHRSEDAVIDIDGGRELARLIPNAEFYETPGEDHTPWTGDDLDSLAEKIEEFLTGSKPTIVHDRVLATVLFTDIVASTEQAERLGDRRWRNVLEQHNEVVRRELDRYRGKEVKTLGDGFLATFDGPARSTHCALSIIQSVATLGLQVRAGVHTGEVEFVDNDVRGVAVNLASRLADTAGPSECIVSRTVKDLVAGAELNFTAHDRVSLKGLTEPMELFVASH